MTATRWITAAPAAHAHFSMCERPTVSFVMVTFGTGRIVLRSLASLAAALDADGLAAEVVVVDHPHPIRGDDTRTTLRLETSGVRLIASDRNLGFGGGNELGIAHTRADVLCLLNPDVLVTPGVLPSLLETVDRAPDAIVAPTLLEPDLRVQEQAQELLPNGATRPLLTLDDAAHLRVGPSIELTGQRFRSAACWLLRRELHESLGGFDPIFDPAYYEDADLVMRLRRSGGRLLVRPDVGVVHVRGGSVDGPPPDTSTQRALFMNRWGADLGGSWTAYAGAG